MVEVIAAKGLLLATSKSDGGKRLLLSTSIARDRYCLRPNHCWPQEIAACSAEQREIVAGHVVQRGIAASHKQGRWQWELTAGSICAARDHIWL
ncbi:hypothetical protein BHE74_00031264 [Ensete ventricosum]|nr:hypothetical protein BHE74_00031264 [Ensete ventricosum]